MLPSNVGAEAGHVIASPLKSRLRALLEKRFLISTQIYLGLGGAVALMVTASLVGWFSFNRVADAQTRVTEGSVPEMAASFGVAQYSGTLVAAAPRLTVAATPEEFQVVSASIAEARAAFEEQLSILEQRGIEGGEFERIRAHADTLIFNIEAIEGDMPTYFELVTQSNALRTQLVDIRSQLADIVVPAIDDQLFYTMTGYRDLGAPAAPRSQHFSEEEFSRYRNLAELLGDANIATELLANAFTLSDASLLEPLREQFEAVVSRIDRNLEALEGSPFHAEMIPVFSQLSQLGIGEGSGFNILDQELRLVARQQTLLELNRDVSVDMVVEIDGLVSAARANVREASGASTAAALTGRSLLLGIGAISVGGAVLIAWLFVGRLLVRRLQRLSEWMRRMAGGDLETREDISGRDEVAEMASALDVFRRHALEVQRLNLVEQLAQELQGKNEQLEDVLQDLQTAQDQIVMREKLAALGELTAGVAHEIRNPLNFVKNFSEASQELLVELKETLEEGDGATLTKDQKELIEEISEDLTGNLGRIRSHGERANRIVQAMLSMGRGSSDWQISDINDLVDEHARLAYHSARAVDPDFQLDLKWNLDPNMGEIEVVSQDLGRVFLNVVSNACYATDQRRRANVEAGGDHQSYMPTLLVTTKRGEDSAVISVRDNGSGIPPDAVDKIFNPFFTTKPTDQGTGLGLAMSNDIVRRHGGSMRVETEAGEFTEMFIELPLKRPDASLLAEAEGEGDPAVAAPSD